MAGQVLLLPGGKKLLFSATDSTALHGKTHLGQTGDDCCCTVARACSFCGAAGTPRRWQLTFNNMALLTVCTPVNPPAQSVRVVAGQFPPSIFLTQDATKPCLWAVGPTTSLGIRAELYDGDNCSGSLVSIFDRFAASLQFGIGVPPVVNFSMALLRNTLAPPAAALGVFAQRSFVDCRNYTFNNGLTEPPTSFSDQGHMVLAVGGSVTLLGLV
jgi:hypothetical protein